MKASLGKMILLVVAVIWGTGFVASAIALEYYSPFQILALRFSIAFLVLLIIYAKKIKELRIHHLKSGGVVGIFLFLAFAFQTIGLQYTSASKNAFLTAVNIVIIPFLGWFILKRPLTLNVLSGAALTLGGIGLLSINTSLDAANFGDILSLICAFFFALQIFFTEYFVKKIEAWQLMLTQMGVASLLSWMMVLIQGKGSLLMTVESLSPIIYLGIMSTLVGFGLQTFAQQYTTSTETGVILATEAFFGVVAAVLILKEAVTPNLLIGAMLIFAGILLVEMNPISLSNRAFKSKVDTE